MVDKIREIEYNLWFNHLTNEQKRPTKRVSDIDYIVLNEIRRISNNEIRFDATKKDNNEAAINTIRVLLAKKQIIIHPRCKTLLRHLKNVKWKSPNSKDKFARSPDDGHYDAVDALKYFVRSINYNKNPYPETYNNELYQYYAPEVRNHDSFNPVAQKEDKSSVYKAIFGIRKK
jgi:hypothetical protein